MTSYKPQRRPSEFRPAPRSHLEADTRALGTRSHRRADTGETASQMSRVAFASYQARMSTGTFRFRVHEPLVGRYRGIMPEFDACIDLVAAIVPARFEPQVAVVLVRSAVERIPGANWISVEWCGNSPQTDSFIRVFARGHGKIREDGPYAQAREQIRHALLEALGE